MLTHCGSSENLTIWQLLADVTVYPKKYEHGFCFAVLCCGYTLTDFPISIMLTSLALWQSNDCPSASKATLMNMDKYFMWIHYERLHNHNKAKHNKTVCIFLGIYCTHGWAKSKPMGEDITYITYSLITRGFTLPGITVSCNDAAITTPGTLRFFVESIADKLIIIHLYEINCFALKYKMYKNKKWIIYTRVPLLILLRNK